MSTNDKIIKLREQMQLRGLDAIVVFTADPHGSEYPAEHFKFREFLSGFNGSAGTLVVTANHAGVWADSRYWVQAAAQLRGSCVELHKDGDIGVPSYMDYLTYLLPSGAKVGFDGRTLSEKEYIKLRHLLGNFGILVDSNVDLAQELFSGRPLMPTDAVWLQTDQQAGESRQDKVARLRKRMQDVGASHFITTALDDIAWLTNLRGADVEYNPVFYAYLVVSLDEEHLFIDPHKLTTTDSKLLESQGITLSLYEYFEEYLRQLPRSARIYFDPQATNSTCIECLPTAAVRIEGHSLVGLLKAVKSDFELKAIQNAHIKDAVAMVHFFRQFEYDLEAGVRFTELDISQRVTEARSRAEGYISDSFESIVAAYGNAAMCHYRPTIENNTRIEHRGLMLIDSGGQYIDGTTDVTRTFALGTLTGPEMTHYTLVLKGHIAMATAIFPAGTTGIEINALAKGPMWKYGVDYGHGTGHGVGFCLNVHEGPQKISSIPNDVPIEPGMVTSIEPGLYIEGSHGIRIENMAVCVEAKKTAFGSFLGFRPLTLIPIDTAPIRTDLLTDAELKWLNDYHQLVLSTLSGHLEGQDLAWLRDAGQELRRR